jgi:NSS family neurotransmitter:Na+ symporter
MLSLLEVPVAVLNERLGMTRRKATIVTVVALAAVGSLAALSSSLTANWTLFGKNAFDLYDYATSNVLLPLGGLLICLFVGWRLGYKTVRNNLTNNGTLKNETVATAIFLLTRFVAPVLIVIILLNGLGII